MRHAVLILAAGVGRRLGMPDGRPKWLVPVGDTTPARVHLEACSRAASVPRIVVVAGHGRAAVEDAVAPWRPALEIEVVANPHYEDRNNWYSLLVGLEAVPRNCDGIFVVNSDLCAPVDWFVTLFDDLANVAGGGVLAVDFDRALTEEAMKVAATDGGRLVRIGKVGVDDPAGEYVGLTFMRRAAATGLTGILASFAEDPARVDAWYEHGMQAHIDVGATYVAAPVPHSGWVEIDDPDDLATAVRIMGGDR